MVLLGMGEDGHTASLFPGLEYALDEWVHPVFDSPKPPPERVSLSAKALANTRCLLTIITGKTKQSAIDQWFSEVPPPVARIDCQGQRLVLLDSSLRPPEKKKRG